MSFANWLTVFSLGMVAVMSPGPDFALTLRNSLVYSRKTGIYTALGITVGHIIHATYCLIGIGAIISRSIILFNIIKWVGAAYLIYIGIKSLKAKKYQEESITKQALKIGNWAAFRIGLLGDVLNPKATLFFLALFTQIIHPATRLNVQVVYGGTIVVQALAWYTLVAVLISQNAVKKLFQSISHWIERITGAVLIGLGLRLAFAKAND
ncbi:MAG: homoserine/threonine efflux transporter [Calothrix sp. FI2-JRJ7]|jgi:RhtB (resistance to homoserine/threonine) family protein|nr:homoserine/threonine efflux transporter [Calothrix sp. FI2-JRJ7]